MKNIAEEDQIPVETFSNTQVTHTYAGSLLSDHKF